ncbi:myb-like protein K [Varroa destructor]|uniref:Uncharacterized protein n=1 Tax=Varroa destructor TaxID=109461 RepID=A0A7M7JDA2_VARDE|nr:myb-like protein K [Varroa destructor]
MLPASGISAGAIAGTSNSTITLPGANSIENGQTVYIVESTSPPQAIVPPQNASKLLLSSVVSMAANSRIKAEPHRETDCPSCEACRSRLQKLDELEIKQAELEMMLQIYQKKLDLSKRLLDEYHTKEKTFLDNIGKIFNGDQIVRILTGHCQKRRGGSSWDDGTLKKAAKLYFLCSPQGYQEILHLKMPLPSSHTLQNVIQKGRPQPLSPKTSVFDPFASTSDLSSSIALVRRGIVQQNRQKETSLLCGSSNRPQQLQVTQQSAQQQPQVQEQQLLVQQQTQQQLQIQHQIQQQLQVQQETQQQLQVPQETQQQLQVQQQTQHNMQLHQQPEQPPAVITLSSSPSMQMPLTGTTSTSAVTAQIPLGSSGSIGTTVPAAIVYSACSQIPRLVPRNVFTTRIPKVNMPDEFANVVTETVTSNEICETSSVMEVTKTHDQETLEEGPSAKSNLICPEGDIELLSFEPEANNSDPPEKDMSVERAVGACVRALVDQVARPPQSSAVRPRAPYVSILRNPNDPNAPAKYNLVVPRHLLRPGQRIVLKAATCGPKSSAPTVQIIEPFRTVDARIPSPTSPGTIGVSRQFSITNPITTLGGQVININKRPVVSSAPTISVRPQISMLPNQGHIIQGQPQIIEIAGSNIGDIVQFSSTAKKTRSSD